MALSWLAPVLFTRPDLGRRSSPRLSVAGWLVVVATASFAWVAALCDPGRGCCHSLITRSAPTFCVETLGIASAVTLPPTVATLLVVALLVVTAAVASNRTRRVIVTLYRTRRANRRHVEAVRIIGRPTGRMMASSPSRPTNQRPTAVSGGRRRAIVVTTAAMELLDPPALAAVLAHRAGALTWAPSPGRRDAQHPRFRVAAGALTARGGAICACAAGDVRRRRGYPQTAVSRCWPVFSR